MCVYTVQFTCSRILPTDADIDKEKRYLQRRLDELKNIEDIKTKIEKEQRKIETLVINPKNLSEIWSDSMNSLKKEEGKKWTADSIV